MNPVKILINQIENTQIKPEVITKDLIKLLSIVEKKKLIPINYHNKEITKINTNKCCKYCNQKSIYYDNSDYLCWKHVQTN